MLDSDIDEEQFTEEHSYLDCSRNSPSSAPLQSDVGFIAVENRFSLPPANTQESCVYTPIFKLPVELLIDIFKFLPSVDFLRNIPAVCQQWYHASHNPSLHSRLILKRHIPAEAFLQAVSCRPLLRILRCPALQHATPMLTKAVNLCSSLQCLNIGFCALNEEVAGRLAHCLPPSLLHLNVEGVNVIEINFITTLIHRCPKLEALNLSHCIAVCDSCVRIISDGLPRLRRLNLDGVLWLSDSGLLSLGKSVAVRNNTLNAIWLDGLELTNSGLIEFFLRLKQIPKHPENFSRMDSALPHNSVFCSGIQVLWISFCDHIEDEAVSLISDLPNLVALTLRKAHQVTSRGLSSLFISNGLTDQRMPQHGLKWLEHLDLSEAPGVNDTVISDICHCCGPRLRSLTLNWCWELSDDGVTYIVQFCVNLRQLSLIGNSIIQGTPFIQTPIRQPYLVILNLTQCNHVQDSILENLASSMPDLYVFDFFGERVGGTLNDICHFDLARALGKVPICGD